MASDTQDLPRFAVDPRLVATDAFLTFRRNLNVAQLLLEYLKLEGVTKIFGIPGGTIIYLMDEIKKQPEFDFVICRHETGAAYIAHGYSVVTDGLGVVLTTSGPAASNPLTGALNAQASGASLLAITGEVPQPYFGQGYLQEGIDAQLDIAAVYRNAVKYSAVISSQAHFATLFQQALRVARSLPGAAAHIGLPNDVAASCVASPGSADGQGNRIPFPNSPDRYRTLPSGTDRENVKLAFGQLVTARRPLIFLGNGSRRALRSPDRLSAFKALVEKFAIPVMTTPDAKGVFPESHEFSLRNYGLTACPWTVRYLQADDVKDRCDALLVLGSSLGELATTVVEKDVYAKMQLPGAHFIQVDLDQSIIGRSYPVTLGIVAEIGATIDALCEFGQQSVPPPGVDGRRELIGAIKKTPPFADPGLRASDAAPINPAALVRVINDEVKAGHVFIDAGNCVGWSLHYMVVDPPLRYHSALNMGPMGFGIGAVIGGKLGAPDQDCVAIVGDGGFMMHGMEVSTAAQNGVGAVWVILNDNDLAMVSQGMAALFPRDQQWPHYYKLGNPDLVKVAEGLGAHAVAIKPDQGTKEFRAELRAALQRARIDRQPQVIVAHIDSGSQPPYGWPQASVPDCGKPA